MVLHTIRDPEVEPMPGESRWEGAQRAHVGGARGLGEAGGGRPTHRGVQLRGLGQNGTCACMFRVGLGDPRSPPIPHGIGG